MNQLPFCLTVGKVLSPRLTASVLDFFSAKAWHFLGWELVMLVLYAHWQCPEYVSPGESRLEEERIKVSRGLPLVAQ